MQAIRITWSDGDVKRSLVLVDEFDTDIVKEAYAASKAVHIPIGSGSSGCQFEPIDVHLLPAPQKSL